MIIEMYRQMLRKVEKIERNRYCSGFLARMNAARDLKISLGQLENLLYPNRVKTLDVELAYKIQKLYRETIEAEIRRLEHERHLLCQMGLRPDRHEMDEIEACLAKAKALLDELASGNRVAVAV